MKIRQITRLTTIAAFAAIAFPSCKTTEENYRNAYEVAKAKQTEGLTADEIAGLQREEAMPRTVYNGDSIPLKGMYVKHIEGGVDNKALRYNVIVASFRQQFNARSLMTRLRDNGYPDAVLLADKDGRYYIGTLTTASLDSAVSVLHSLSESSPVALRTPYPYILQKP